MVPLGECLICNIRHSPNAKILTYINDPYFANVLDCMIVVDFDESNEKTLIKYMGQENYLAYKKYGTDK